MPKMVNNKYTSPKIKATGKIWYVWFRFLDDQTGKMKLVIKKGENANNSNLPKSERRAEIEALRQAIVFKLVKQGWNPLNNSYPVQPIQTSAQIEFDRLQKLGFNDALDFAHSKCTVAQKTKADYLTCIKFFKLAAEQVSLDKTPVADIKRKHVKFLLERVRGDRKWSNHAYNKNLGYLSAVLGRLMDYEIIETNPTHGIKQLAVAETQMYVPITIEEKNKIREYLYVHNYLFFVYLLVIYHTGIRPKEILSLKIKDLAEDLSEIIIYPNLDAENSKTKNIRKVPINNELRPFLRDLKLHEQPKEHYIFGSPFSGGKGYKGNRHTGKSGTSHPDYFKPSPTQIKRDTLTKLWNEIVKVKLGIDKYQYAMKHTGADEKIMAGVPLDALKDMYGHSSKFMTEKYARKIKDVYKQQIVELSPAF